MFEAKIDPQGNREAILHLLGEVYQTTLVLLRSRDGQDRLADQSYLLESLWAKAAIDNDRVALDAVAERLDFLSARAFREGDGPKADWTLSDWGHLWEAFSGLAKIYLELDHGGQRKEDLAFVREDETRALCLFAFLNEAEKPEPRRLGGIAAFLRDKDKEKRPWESNTVHNRLVRLARRGLVQRAGPVQGWYELTQVGFEIAQQLKEKALPVPTQPRRLQVITRTHEFRKTALKEAEMNPDILRSAESTVLDAAA